MFGRKRRQGGRSDPPFRASETHTRALPIALPDFLARLAIGDRAPLSGAHIVESAERLGLPLPEYRAVIEVEADGRRGFAFHGLPTISFSPSVFSRVTQGRFDATHSRLSHPDPRALPDSQEARWRQLAAAYALDSEGALRSTRWGMFAMLGDDCAAYGFPSAGAFAAYLSGAEARQLEAFEDYLRTQDLLALIRAHHWAVFAARYNGAARAKAYGVRLGHAFRRLAGPDG